MYQSLYRKYRPKSFADVIGQDHIVKTLKNQIKFNKIGHAYLFSGTRGTGKTSVAKIFAKAVNCTNNSNGEPCNNCDVCMAVNNNSAVDIIEIDAASNNSVNDIRELKESIIYSPSSFKYKVYIIDEVHMLSTGAFNALLKTLEEPPAHAIFILATTEPEKLPDTILSRCQKFDFKLISQKDIYEYLSKISKDANINIEEKGLKTIAFYGNGSMRDAISILEQCSLYDENLITYDDVCEMLGTANDENLYKLLELIKNKDTISSLKQLDKILSYGMDIGNLIKSLIYILRDMLIYKSGKDNLKEILYNDSETIKEKANLFGEGFLTDLLNGFILLQKDIKYSPSPSTLLEVTVLRFLNPEISYDISGLISRIEKLEELVIKKGVHVENLINKEEAEKEVTSYKESLLDVKKDKKEIPEIIQTPLKNEKDFDINNIWEKVKDVVKKEKRPLYILMDKGVPYLKNDSIMIEYPEEYNFMKEELAKPFNKEYIDRVISEVCGKSVGVTFVTKQSEDEMVKKVKDFFENNIEIV